jgi:multidrug transporter EmrE-like cation transporter
VEVDIIMALLKNNLILSILVIFFTTYSQIILRMRIKPSDDSFAIYPISYKSLIFLSTDVFIVSSIVSFMASFLCWSVALSNNINATKVYPIVASLTILCVSLANVCFFQDKININNIFGILLIIFGIIFVLR